MIEDMENKLTTIKAIARLLDSQFEVAGIKFGLDPIINIVPWLGSFIGAAISIYLFKIAKDMQISRVDYFRMIINIVIDFVVGLVPILGLIFDVFYKANMRNLKILEAYTKEKFVEGEVLAS